MHRCLREIKKLDREVLRRALRVIRHTLAEDPFVGKRLRGKFAGLYSFRISDYRVVYEVRSRELIVAVLRVRHRRDAYDGL